MTATLTKDSEPRAKDQYYNLDQYQMFIHQSRYARWLEKENRRETWPETVNRYISHFAKRTPQISSEVFEEVRESILGLKVLPSMRALMCAGKALERSELAGYNCSMVAVDDPRIFSEIMFILLNGAGAGFSVERQYVNKLPIIAEEFHNSDTVISVGDSKEGWATAFQELISLLYTGQIPTWDVSKVRPAGARLKTFGGRASGPAPLVKLFRITCDLFKNAPGRRLTSLECHDLICAVAEVIVVGGVRRSALISLSNLSDDRMRNAKSGQWWEANPQRAMANNSAAYSERPDMGIFMKEWTALYDSKSGERGIYNQQAAILQAKKTGRRKVEGYQFLPNPCGEALGRSSGGLCNLTEIIAREEDTLETLLEKARLASIMGTMQSALTNFKYVRSVWKRNAEEERLLGVSITGIAGNTLLNGSQGKEKLIEALAAMKQVVIATNQEFAELIGINSSVATTVIKPSGTAGALARCSSGIHAWHSQYFIRRIRADKKDPLSQMLQDAGVPWEEDMMKPDSTLIFSFPMKAPEGSLLRDSLTAIEQLDQYRIFKNVWCEHNVSITISVKEEEWMEVGAYVYKHFDDICGVSFLPFSDHSYQQQPYTECTKEEYELTKARMPKIDWSKLQQYEIEDSTTGQKELACSGSGSCDIF